MTQKTIAALLAQADATLPDNNAQEISAADVRELIKDLIDTLKPGFGAVGSALIVIPAVGLTPVVVTYASNFAVTAEFTSVLAAGTVQRNALGLPTVNNRITFLADVAAQSGSEIGFTLWRDGVIQPGGSVVTAQGAGNVVQLAFTTLNGTPIAGDPVYEVRVAKLTGAADTVELSNVRFILEMIPTLGV